ncbi:biopolymer transporter ExbD [Dysgonomonas sp. Marseille-P4677]|uniref:ExbD/TolR family protein n=1 Tax=Dysgonomonas sp. Marseille-P4677 TaxID=2364790 RepID=UPI0019122F8B|nr:biopolymer transporter ExbD [Dysgonomonas sp. Marseille-P4677]MBK5719916.1 biopolymer transporter ExbD [Dysgonomonas sp. Marseille-P4677]
MASIDTSGGGNGKRSKPQKKILRVDFTPMVDMNMLLITFFMFCTTLSIPQVMDIAMPANEGRQPIPGSKSVTVILGEQDKIYYYAGVADYEDYASLKETNYLGLREMLLERNNTVASKIQDLKKKFYKKEIDDKSFKSLVSEAKRSKEGLNVVIKATKDSNYKNLVDVLDEMQICGVDKYAIIDLEEGDKFLMENLKTKGSLTAMAKRP